MRSQGTTTASASSPAAFHATVDEPLLVALASDILQRGKKARPVSNNKSSASSHGHGHSHGGSKGCTTDHHGPHQNDEARHVAYVLIGTEGTLAPSPASPLMAAPGADAAAAHVPCWNIVDFLPVRLTAPKAAATCKEEESAAGGDDDEDSDEAIENHLSEVATFVHNCLVPGSQRVVGVVAAPPVSYGAREGESNNNNHQQKAGGGSSNNNAVDSKAAQQQKEKAKAEEVEQQRQHDARVNIRTAVLTNALLRALQSEADGLAAELVSSSVGGTVGGKGHVAATAAYTSPLLSGPHSHRLVLLQATLSMPTGNNRAQQGGLASAFIAAATGGTKAPPLPAASLAATSEAFIYASPYAYGSVTPIAAYVTTTTSHAPRECSGAAASPSSAFAPRLVRFGVRPAQWAAMLAEASAPSSSHTPSSSKKKQEEEEGGSDGALDVWRVGAAANGGGEEAYLDLSGGDKDSAAFALPSPPMGADEELPITSVEPLSFSTPAADARAAASSSSATVSSSSPAPALVYIPMAFVPSSVDEGASFEEAEDKQKKRDGQQQLTVAAATVREIAVTVASSANIYGTHRLTPLNTNDSQRKEAGGSGSLATSVVLHQSPRILFAGVAGRALLWNGLGVLGDYFEDDADTADVPTAAAAAAGGNQNENNKFSPIASRGDGDGLINIVAAASQSAAFASVSGGGRRRRDKVCLQSRASVSALLLSSSATAGSPSASLAEVRQTLAGRSDAIVDSTLAQLADIILAPSALPCAFSQPHRAAVCGVERAKSALKQAGLAAADLSSTSSSTSSASDKDKDKDIASNGAIQFVAAGALAPLRADFGFYGSRGAAPVRGFSLVSASEAAAALQAMRRPVACCGPPIDPTQKPFSPRCFNLISLTLVIMTFVGCTLILSSPTY